MNDPTRAPLVEVLMRQRESWESGERLPVEDLLERNSHLREDDDAVLDLIYQETVLREAAGEAVSLGDYLARYPHLEHQLRLQFEIEQALTQDQAADAALTTDLPKLEGCEILGEMGRGAMGIVYRGWQTAAQRPVAVKVLSPDAPAGRSRAEVVAASRLLHPNIVQLFEVKEYDGRPALLLEYVEGGNLAQKLAGKPQPPRDAARLLQTLAWAMAYAHGRGVIHRDLKPSNVLLSAGPDEPLHLCVPKISDFGLARFLEGGSRLTATNDVLGTPSYMAPEQAGGAAAAGESSDVYSLGAILYECLTGRPPLLGETVLDTLEQVRHQEPVPPSRLQPRIPRDLEIICLKCLHKAPGRRYSTARDLAEDLSRFLSGEPIRARPVGPFERVWKWSHRHPSAGALVLVSLLAVASLFAGGALLNQALRRQRDLARDHAAELGFQLDQTRRLLYTAQLLRVGSVWEGDPAQALRMLDDPTAFPPDLRCLCWAVLHGQCKRYRTAMLGLGSPATVLVHSPRGRLLLSGDATGDVYLWDAETARWTSRLVGHKREVTALALSPDGWLLATGDAGGEVRLWDMPAGAERGTLNFAGRVGGLAWHRDGKTLIVGAGQVTLWDVGPLRQRRQLRGETHSMSGVAISPNGEVVAAGGADNSVRLWDARTGKPFGQMRGHTSPVTGLGFTGDGTRLVTAGLDGALCVWDHGRGALLDRFEPAVGPIVSLAMHPSEVLVAVAGTGKGEDGLAAADMQVWDLTGRRGGEARRSHGGASAVAFAPDGRTLFTAGADRAIKSWDHPAQRERVSLRTEQGRGIIPSEAMSRDGRTLAYVHQAIEVILVDLDTGTERQTLRGQGRPIQAVALTASGDLVAAAVGHKGEPAELLVWSTRSGRLTQAMSGHGGQVAALAFSPDGKQIASAGRDGVVRVWDVTSDKVRRKLDAGAGPLVALAWEGERIAAVGGELTAWNARTGEVASRRALGVEGNRLALTRSGEMAAVGVGESVQLFDLAGEGTRELLAIRMKEIAHVAFSADGQTLAVAGTASGVKLWDVPTGQERASLPWHQGGATFAGFADGGPLLVTVSRSRVARLWHGRHLP